LRDLFTCEWLRDPAIIASSLRTVLIHIIHVTHITRSNGGEHHLHLTESFVRVGTSGSLANENHIDISYQTMSVRRFRRLEMETCSQRKDVQQHVLGLGTY
jgi:hypothetical protein